MILKVIAYARNGHTDKFGIPRQSRDASPIETRIVFEPEYRVPEALRGIEGYSHLWLIWGFSENQSPETKLIAPLRQRTTNDQSPITNHQSPITWSPTVRPPRLGGNKRMGVFATRSPFRPNPLGLSSVRLLRIEDGDLIVSGADLLDGTPIYDIKPYLSFSDSHEDAKNGFAEETADYQLKVVWEATMETYLSTLPAHYQHIGSTSVAEWKHAVEYILSQDPRPGYQDDPEREYKLDYDGITVTFLVQNDTVIIKNIQKMQKDLHK